MMTKDSDFFQNEPFDCKTLDISYLAIPKNASSYIKSIFYQLENFTHPKKTVLENSDWHALYKNRKGYKTFSNRNRPLVVFFRDPLIRFISAFNDRIIRREHILADIHCNEEKLEIFADRFEYFLNEIHTIKWHFSPQIYYIQKYLKNKYLQIYSVEEINDVLSQFFSKANHDNQLKNFFYSIKNKRVNKTGKKFLYLTTENIPSTIRNKINLFYSEDYDLLNKINK